MSNDTDPKAPSPQGQLESALASRTTKIGDLVVGKVVKITGSVAFVDYGARSEGYIELSELKDEEGNLAVAEGDQVEAEIVQTRGAVRLSARRAQAGKALRELEAAWKNQQPVEGQVVAVNKGGFEVRVEGMRAFCPSSQFAENFVREPQRFVGQTLQFRITELGGGKSLVLSRRALLEEQKEKMKEALGEQVQVGEVKQGRVTRLTDFGAFIELAEGLEGLVHVSEISHDRINHPSEKLKEGDAVEVQVLRVEPDKGRIGLSIKALESDPWTQFARSLQRGQKLSGKVARIQPFGAFVTIGPGVDGLLHVSAITVEKRIESPAEVLQVGQELEVVVDRVELDKQRIALLTAEVAEARKPTEIQVSEGDVVKGKVSRVEKYGVFVEIAPRVVGLVPNAEMATDRNADHARLFPIGTELEVKVVEVDRERNRIRLSRKALENHEEEVAMADYRKKQKAESKQSLGTFGDLLKDFLNKK